MCYASPGPRCEAHAKERYDNIREKTSRKFNDLMEAGRAKEKFEEKNPDALGSPTHKRLQKKKDNLRQETMDLIKKRSEAQDEMDATSGGIATLRKQTESIHEDEYSAADRMKLAMRLKKGRETFSAKMLAYDKEHGTVNGRKPSRYGTMEGMKELRAKTVKQRQAYLNATTEEEKTAAWDKYQTANKSYEHARATFERSENGKATPAAPHQETPVEKYHKAKEEYSKVDAEYSAAMKKSDEILKKISDLEIEQESQGRYMTTYSPNNRRSYTREAAENNNKWIDEDIAQMKVVRELSDKRKTLRQKMKELEVEKDKA